MISIISSRMTSDLCITTETPQGIEFMKHSSAAKLPIKPKILTVG